MGFSVLDETGLKSFGVKSLRRYKDDSQKLLMANRLLCSIMNSIRPRAVVVLKPAPQKATNFNLQLVSFIKGLANSRYCPLYFLTIKQVKTIMPENTRLKNQRQLSQLLKSRYPELEYYLPDTTSRVVKDREKYYQPLFAAIGVSLSYLKLAKNEDNQNNTENQPTGL